MKMVFLNKIILGKQVNLLSYALRYNQPNWMFSGTVGANAMHLYYYHKQSEQLQFGVEFEANFKLQVRLIGLGLIIHIC